MPHDSDFLQFLSITWTKAPKGMIAKLADDRKIGWKEFVKMTGRGYKEIQVDYVRVQRTGKWHYNMVKCGISVRKMQWSWFPPTQFRRG